MSITVNFYTFSKKTNSTAQPTGTPALSASCLLKDTTSIITPIIELRNATPIAYNYCHISSFNRYYFITNISWNMGVWEISLKCDVLATFKSVIGSTNGYVLRSANRYDGTIIDELYPATTDVTTEIAYSTNVTTTWTTGFTGFTNGYYVVGVQGTGAGNVNGVIYYSLSASQFVTLINNFYANSSNTAWWGNLVNGVVNSLAKLDDFITSIRWYPYPLIYSQTANAIYLGTWNTSVTAFSLEDTRPFTKELTIMRHPQAATRGSFLNYMPYSRYEIVDPLVGVIPISSDIAKVINTIRCTITPDFTTGQAKYELTTAGGVVFYCTYINFAVDIHLSGNEVNLGAIAGQMTNAAANFATGNYLGAGVGLASAIGEGIGTPGSNQSSGGFVQYGDGTIMLRGYFKPIVDEDRTNKGRPLCEWNNPATLGGYMIIDKPHVATTGLADETAEVNSYLASGFYYE